MYKCHFYMPYIYNVILEKYNIKKKLLSIDDKVNIS